MHVARVVVGERLGLTYAATPKPTMRATPEPTPKPEPVVKYSLVIQSDQFSGSLTAAGPFGPDFVCTYGTRKGRPLATLIGIHPTGRHVDQVVLTDDDGPGPHNPTMMVIVDGITYLWDRASNIKYDGYAGGKITYKSGGLGVKLDIELHQVADSMVRLWVAGTLECPPDPLQ